MMPSALAETGTVSDGWLVLFFFVRIFLGFFPAIIAQVRVHPRKWWIYVLAFLATGFGSFGWPTYLVGWIYFALIGLPFELNEIGWVLLGWSVIIWAIAIFWATRKIKAFEQYRSPG